MALKREGVGDSMFSTSLRRRNIREGAVRYLKKGGSFSTLGGKFLYGDICDAKLTWDAKLPSNLMQRWVRWEEKLPSHVTVSRSLAAYQEDIQAIELHAFGDASGKGVAAAVYAVVVQAKGVNQGLVASRARLAKKGLTIPWYSWCLATWR